MNDRNVAAQALDDFENMRGEKNRGSAGDHALQHGFQRAGGDRVHAFDGLVEKQDLGSMNHGRCQGELLLHAVGVVGDELFVLVRELHEIEQLGGAPGGGYPVEAIHSSGETEELSTGETSEQSHAFGHDANLTLDVDRMSVEIEAEDFDLAGTGRQQSCEHLDRGGFPRAVWAEKAEELSGRDAQVDTVDCNQLPEAASQGVGADGGGEVHPVFESSTIANPTRRRGIRRRTDCSRLVLCANFFLLSSDQG